MKVRIVGSLLALTTACTEYEQPPVQYVAHATISVQQPPYAQAPQGGPVQYYVQQPAAAQAQGPTQSTPVGQDSAAQSEMAQADPTQQPELGNVPDVPTGPGERVDESTITSALQGYGGWDNDPTYGYVWTPSEDVVGADFVPYGTNGDWLSTDEGWYWQSSYPWGWLPFHYGRWVQRTGRWGWLPGRMFAPAWVDWRTTESYVGWAPLPPEGMMIDAPYAFCGAGMLGAPGLWQHVVYGPAAAGIYAGSRPVPATYGLGGARYSRGPAMQGAQPGGAVPVASAWHMEVGSRAGMPATAMNGAMAHPVGMTNVPMTTHPTGPGPVTATAYGSRPVSMQAGVAPIQTSQRYASPAAVYRPQSTYAAPNTVYRGTSTYAAPGTVYRAASTYNSYSAASRSTYAPSAPAQAYRPAYSAPAYHSSYSAPAYHPSYSAPAYRSSYSAPAYHSSGGGYRGGGRR